MPGRRRGAIKVGKYLIEPTMIKKFDVVLAEGEEAMALWAWVKRFDVKNKLIRSELGHIIDDLYPDSFET